MTRLFVAAMAALTVVVLAVPAMAAAPVPGPKIAVHIIPHVASKGYSFCDGVAESTATACSNFVTQGALRTPYDLFICVAQGDSLGVSGATFGILYDDVTGSGVDFIGEFHLCASGLQFPSATWPASGSGNVITWNTETQCGTTRVPPDGVEGTVGGFYIYTYSDDRFQITKHTKLQAPVLQTANCNGVQENRPDAAAGWVGFGTMNGCNPCIVDCATPAQPTTWGRIKSQYGAQHNE